LERDNLKFQFGKATEGYELKITLEEKDKKMDVVPISKVGESYYLYLSRKEFLQLRGKLLTSD